MKNTQQYWSKHIVAIKFQGIKAMIANVRAGIEHIRGAAPQLTQAQRLVCAGALHRRQNPRLCT